MNDIIVVMGVSGSGKSTLGEALAAARGAVFLEGDSFHPPANVAWMRAGNPLTDDMRWPWLSALANEAVRRRASGESVVISCSALKKSYRDHLRAIAAPMRFMFLDVPEDELRTRMEGRKNHYMPPALLTSQLATLEAPGPEEMDCIRLPGTSGKRSLLSDVLKLLRTDRNAGPDITLS
jgi:carbohydrate kinase (thermoresistant glucokinase family)